MKGVVLTSTGQPLVTPSPAELARLLVEGSPGVGLDFTKIFDEEREEDEKLGVEGEKEEIKINGGEGGMVGEVGVEEEEEEEPLPPSPSDRKNKSARGIPERPQAPIPMPIPTRVAPARPPSRTKPSNTTLKRRTSMLVPSSSSDAASAPARRQSLFIPPTTTTSSLGHPHHHHQPLPKYDLADEENLPSPFLKRNAVGAKKDEKEATGVRKKGSLGSLALRAAVKSGVGASIATSAASGRTSIASARKAGEEARRALART
jgi:NIMA (never in mitosis gene a)-related kinase 2